MQVVAHFVGADRHRGYFGRVLGQRRSWLLYRGIVARLFDRVANLAHLQRSRQVVKIEIHIGLCDSRHFAGLVERIIARKGFGRQRFGLGEVEVVLVLVLIH